MRRTPGLVTVVVAVTAIFTTGAAFFLAYAASGSMRTAGVDPVTAGRVQGALVAAFMLVGAVTCTLAWFVATAVSRAMSNIRIATLARARGEIEVPLQRHWVREFGEVSDAVDRMHGRILEREDALSREMTDVAVAIDTVSEGIVRMDANGRLVRSNPAARSLLNLSGRATGHPLATEIRHAELRRILAAAAAGQVVSPEEVSVDDRRLIVSAQPLRDAAGANAGAVLSLVDLTEVRRLESMRRDFVANVSHELKTPLTSIRGYTETMLADPDLPAEMRAQFLEVVHKNANRLHSIVDDLLDLSRIESGSWRPEMHEVKALEVIDDVWSSLAVRAQERKISFVPPTEQILVLADPAAFRQVLTNLLDNALRYTPAGGRIEVTARPCPAHRNGGPPEPDFVLFEVRDNGSGIPSDSLGRIFERFYRVDPARSRAEGGTGLGLAIVRHLVESMGGDVSAESELGKGTTIRFKLRSPA